MYGGGSNVKVGRNALISREVKSYYFLTQLLHKDFLFLAAQEIIGITCIVKKSCNITYTFQMDIQKLFVNRNSNGSYNVCL